MSLLDTAKATATKLLGQHGSLVTYRAMSRGTYDPATSTATEAEAATSVRAQLVPPSRFELSSGLVRSGDAVLLMPGEAFTADPLPGDRVTMNGAGYEVIGVEPIAVGTAAAAWRVILRK